MTEYVLGFMFSTDVRQVALIEKQTPTWQFGKLNGIGGKIEPGETAGVAMTREFLEETGVPTSVSEWDRFCVMRSDNWVVHCFSCVSVRVFDVKTMEREKVGVYWVSDLALGTHRTLSNIPWLVPLAINHQEHNSLLSVSALYS